MSGDAVDRLPDRRSGALHEALGERLDRLESLVYVDVPHVDRALATVQREARAAGLDEVLLRARLLQGDVRSRLGDVGPALEHQRRLRVEALARGWHHLAQRACLYLISSADRVGLRAESHDWIRRAVAPAPPGFTERWRVEADVVSVMMAVSRLGVERRMIDPVVEQLRSLDDPVLTATMLANLGEMVGECADPDLAGVYADAAEAEIAAHPDAAGALTWESIARVRLVQHDLPAADSALQRCLDVARRRGLADVNGDPALSLAELRLLQHRPAAALAALDDGIGHGDRRAAWMAVRAKKLASAALADLGRWQEAYAALLEHHDLYERMRSVDAERAVAETQALQIAEAERRRARAYAELALRDPLTGLRNRRFVQDRLDALSRPAPAMDGRAVALAILDLDHFKRINDRYSHDAGDEVLRRVGAALTADLRERRLPPSSVDDPALHLGPAQGPGAGPDPDPAAPDDGPDADFVARLGGEEFVLVLFDRGAATAHRTCEALRRRIGALMVDDIGPDLRVTVSVGLARTVLPTDGAALLRAADLRLYEAKHAGRDRVVGP